MKLQGLSTKNIRCLNASAHLRLKPLTIVVGANSSGKSTFVRLLPLLRQSIEKPTRGPILWYGPYVDFGDFDVALNRSSTEREICFSFDVEFDPDKPQPYGLRRVRFLETTKIKISFQITKTDQRVGTYINKLHIKLFSDTIEAALTSDGVISKLTINNHELTSENFDFQLRMGESLLATSTIKKSEEADSDLDSWYAVRAGGPFHTEITNHLFQIFDKRTGKSKIGSVARRLGVGSEGLFLENLQELCRITSSSSKKAQKIKPNSPWVQKLRSLVLADRLNILLNRIDSNLRRHLKGVRYIGPTRAAAERFYRHQDLAVDEVDPQGSNLAMFMMGLTEDERESFSAWCHERLGFRIIPTTEGSHVSISLSEGDKGEMFNIADMGFGYSQILPVAASLWKSVNDREIIAGKLDSDHLEEIDAITLIIEQPELHLHPRIQAKFADLIAQLSNLKSSVDLNIICETHSETIINHIGILIGEGIVDPNSVQILIFEKADDRNSTTVSTATFTQEGTLENWPYGFFLPD